MRGVLNCIKYGEKMNDKQKSMITLITYAAIFSGTISLISWFLIFSGYETEEAISFPIIVFIMLFFAQSIWGYVRIKRYKSRK